MLTAGIVVVYATARIVLTPDSYGEIGPYRSAALNENAQREPLFAGALACEECHSEILELVGKFEHKGISCETCHGPGTAHGQDPEIAMGKLADDGCLRCHAPTAGRPEWMKQVDPAEHYTGESCKECHLPHQPNEVP